MEYTRANFDRIVIGVPTGCQVDLLACGHAHNQGLVPLLGLWTPPATHDQLPDLFQMIEKVSNWCAGLSEEDVNAIVTTTTAPTWEELLHMRIYPPR